MYNKCKLQLQPLYDLYCMYHTHFHILPTFMKPSLFSLCMLLAALCSLLLCDRSTESATCHQVLQLSSRARPTTLATATSTAFTVTLAESTLNIAKRAIPVTRHAKVSANRTKDGTQHVFFHFFPEDGGKDPETNAVILKQMARRVNVSEKRKNP